MSVVETCHEAGACVVVSRAQPYFRSNQAFDSQEDERQEEWKDDRTDVVRIRSSGWLCVRTWKSVKESPPGRILNFVGRMGPFADCWCTQICFSSWHELLHRPLLSSAPVPARASPTMTPCSLKMQLTSTDLCIHGQIVDNTCTGDDCVHYMASRGPTVVTFSSTLLHTRRVWRSAGSCQRSAVRGEGPIQKRPSLFEQDKEPFACVMGRDPMHRSSAMPQRIPETPAADHFGPLRSLQTLHCAPHLRGRDRPRQHQQASICTRTEAPGLIFLSFFPAYSFLPLLLCSLTSSWILIHILYSLWNSKCPSNSRADVCSYIFIA